VNEWLSGECRNIQLGGLLASLSWYKAAHISNFLFFGATAC